MKNLEDDISEKRKEEIKYNTRHLLSKDDLEKGLFGIKMNLSNKLSIVLFVMVAILMTLIIGLYFIK